MSADLYSSVSGPSSGSPVVSPQSHRSRSTSLSQGSISSSGGGTTSPPMQPSRSLFGSSVGVGVLGSRMSPLPSSRRVSLVTVSGSGPGSAPASPLLPASPGGLATVTRTTLPNLRDLHSGAYQTRVCGQHPNLAHVLRAALLGQASVVPDGKVEITPQTPNTAATSLSSLRIASAPIPAEPLSGSQVGSDSVAPPPPRVFVGLSVGPSHGQIYWEGRMAWPVADAESKDEATSSPSTPRDTGRDAVANARDIALRALLANLVSRLPPLPPGLITPPSQPRERSGSRSTTPLTTGDSPPTPSFMPGGGVTPDLQPTSSGRPRRSSSLSGSSESSDGFGWTAGDVVLSVYFLLDVLDVDSKQITFLAPCATPPGVRAWDHQALLCALYKADLSRPASDLTDAEQTTTATTTVANPSMNAANACKQAPRAIVQHAVPVHP